MMQLKIVFVLAIVVGTYAHMEEDTDELDYDAVSFLQTSVVIEQQKGKQLGTSDIEFASEYELPDPSKCTTEAGAVVETGASFAVVPEKSLAKPDSASQVRSDDPSGAPALRILLQIMTVLVILDGMRRWTLQKQSVSIPKAQENKEGETAGKLAWIQVIKAARSADMPSFQKALDAGASLTLADAWGCTPLHFAALGGSVNITAELLKQGVEIDALDAGDETPLHIAAAAGHTAICELLHGAGAKLDAVDTQGVTPLVAAGRASQEHTCRLLSDLGAGVAGLADEDLPPLVVTQAVRKMLAESA